MLHPVVEQVTAAWSSARRNAASSYLQRLAQAAGELRIRRWVAPIWPMPWLRNPMTPN